ncbi:DUF2304 domain-containing protein [Patescibacteria group bacterium]|nr:DUF2304 domain-containing protein [Patescibacteria group bacterium]
MRIQYLLLLALAATTALTWYRASKQAIRPLEAVGWTILWVGAAVIVLLPGITSLFANQVGIGRGADLVVYVSVFVLFLLVFHLHVVHDRIEKSITEFVRHDALRQLPKAEVPSQDRSHG